MPSTSTTGSANIATLDSNIVADLCAGKFKIDLTPSIFIGSGADNVLGAKIRIKNPYGVVVKDWTGAYDIQPNMSAVVEFTIPTQGGNYQYGDFIVEVKLFDENSKEYVVSKTVPVLCIPSGKGKKYGSLSAKISGICKDGRVRVVVDPVPVYNGKTVVSKTESYTIEYPTSSELSPLVSTTGNFSVPLFEGVYKVTGEMCATYNYGDNVSAKIKYKVSSLKDVRCGIDECLVFPRLASLNANLKLECSPEEKENTTNIILDSLNLLKLIQLAVDCGKDASDYILELSQLLGIDVADFGYVSGGSPSREVIIEGCNVTKNTSGLTDTYTIDNFEYVVDVQDNGGVLVVAAATLNGCKKTQQITFNMQAAYTQIKNIINNSSTEQTYWASIVKATLNTLNITGLTIQQLSNMTLTQLFQYLFDSVAACCACTSSISNVEVEKVGADVRITWETAGAFSVDVYIDDIFVGNVLASIEELTIPNGADGEEHSYRLISKCANGKTGGEAQDVFTLSRCIAIDPPSLSSNNVNGVECPYDLNYLAADLPVGIGLEWHTANNTNANSLVGNPEAVASGVYWAFAKDTNGCYSTGVPVTVTCEAAISCTAPQNLSVVAVSEGFLIEFQGASNPPPYNSYLVKRRLKSDADIDANYDTIGTPVWNASTNKWQIVDETGVDNTLYVYIAISLCANDARPFAEYQFANITCPELSLTPAANSIDYSFVPVGGEVSKYEVYLYASNGITIVSANTVLPAFSDPITGSFTGLTQNTDYKVRIKIYIGGHGGVSKTCDWNNTTTGEIEVCPDITGIDAEGFGGTNP